MSNIDTVLEEVAELNATVRPADAEQRLHSLMSSLGDSELREREDDLRRAITQFLPKRRRRLTALLDGLVETVPNAPVAGPAQAPDSDVDIEPLGAFFVDRLNELSQHHIFQWSTFYRDSLSRSFDQFLEAAHRTRYTSSIWALIRLELAKHAQEIFQKGYYHLTSRGSELPQYAVTKSLNGLQRFLDLPIEFYSTNLPTIRSTADARLLRSLCSAMVGAILEGYAGVLLNRPGSQVLPRFPRSWAHTLPFLTSSDLSSFLARLEAGEFRDGVTKSVVPFAKALDELSVRKGDYTPLPVLAQFSWESRRLDISLNPPPYAAEPQLIEAQCFLDAAFLHRSALDEARRQGISLLVAPIRSDLHATLTGSPLFDRIVVPADDESIDGSAVIRKVINALEYTIYQRKSPRVGAQPLEYNFARGFPLQNPFLTRYYRVYRSSVHELLGAFERRNGVRLWCSVRRSGKTTACFNLGSTTGRSVVVSQTCAGTEQVPEDNLFYEHVCETLTRDHQLKRSFFRDLVVRCAASRGSEDDRFVFVLDEYETLFGRLQSAARRDRNVRYAVVQPLLDQMVAFARDNLLVFLGQQPNAHFILMDQNQLSASIEQDSFPLFRHDRETVRGEFPEFIRKVLSDRADCDLHFVNAIFAETAGHPYLTVNLLVEFVDWLIETQRPVAQLSLKREDVEAFAATKLRRSRVSLCPEYQFFREVVAHATSAEGRRDVPWLHAVYSCLREICNASPDTFACSRGDFDAMVDQLGLPAVGFSPDLLLATGNQANFLQYNESSVWPKIRLLGRIAAVSQREVMA